jgi:DNA repair protein RecO (recombination protein O)
MLKRTEGIVLRNRPHHDADLIVTYLTPDSGIINLYAKSPRKVGSRFGSSLEPLTFARISFFGKEHANLPKLTQSDIINSFYSLRESIKLFLKISEILELTLRLFPEREPNRNLFSLLLNTLRSIENDPGNSIYIIYYKLRALLIAGFAPKVGDCARCGSSTKRFYLREGATLCNICTDTLKGSIELSTTVERVYNYLLRIRPSVLGRLRLEEDVRSGLEALINSHINYSVVSRLNTHAFTEAISKQGSVTEIC